VTTLPCRKSNFVSSANYICGREQKFWVGWGEDDALERRRTREVPSRKGAAVARSRNNQLPVASSPHAVVFAVYWLQGFPSITRQTGD